MALNAGEAIERMLVEKKISTKINYEVLKDLADGFGPSTADSNSSSTVPSGVQNDRSGEAVPSGLLPPISRTPLVTSGRLPSLSARKRTFSSLEPTTHTNAAK